jgi:hypothetical protein
MKRILLFISILVVVVLVWGLANGSKSPPLPDGLQNQLVLSSSFEALSLNPTTISVSDPEKSKTNMDTLIGYPILGSVKITDDKLRKELINSVCKDIAEPNHRQYACMLEPRHGIRCIEGTNSILMAICYTCGDVLVERNGKDEYYLIKMNKTLLSPSSKQLFDKIFKSAGVKTDTK